MHTKIAKVGFEIEGEFSNELIDAMEYLGGSFVPDGSLRYCGESSDFHSKWKVGHSLVEYNSTPYSLRELKKVEALFTEMDKFYKRGHFHYNSSAGFHVHLSFTPKMAPEILSVQFTDFFVKKMKKRFVTAFNARKNNSFCKVKKITEQEIISPFDRYRAVNYSSLRERQGTVEFRIFPTSTPKRMFNYVLFTVATVKEFLRHELSTEFTYRFSEKKDLGVSFTENSDLKNQKITEMSQMLRMTGPQTLGFSMEARLKGPTRESANTHVGWFNPLERQAMEEYRRRHEEQVHNDPLVYPDDEWRRGGVGS